MIPNERLRLTTSVLALIAFYDRSTNVKIKITIIENIFKYIKTVTYTQIHNTEHVDILCLKCDSPVSSQALL
ncbi:hypothetical protein VCHA53O466_50122 [Vibrio chagasii]|nr:hypothetical protein VCHA53O466_50122 [Vibrio chagasii]